MSSGDWGGALAPSPENTMNDFAACGMVGLVQRGLGGDRLQPATGVGVDWNTHRKTRFSGGREAATVCAAGSASQV